MPRPRRCGAPATAARGATLYVTLEPCSHHGKTPPCADAIMAAGIARVVSALEDPNPEVAGRGPRAAARGRHRGRCRRSAPRRRGAPMPGISAACATAARMSRSSSRSRPTARSGSPGRKPAAITGEAARARVHLMRAMNDAILIGIGTVLADDPLLTCRLPGMEHALAGARRARQRLAAAAELAARRDRARHADLGRSPRRTRRAENESGADATPVSRCCACAGANGRLDLAAVLRALAGRGITRLMVEGGPIVVGGVPRAPIWSTRRSLFRAPETHRRGRRSMRSTACRSSALTQSPRLRLAGSEQVGADTLADVRARLNVHRHCHRCRRSAQPSTARAEGLRRLDDRLRL